MSIGWRSCSMASANRWIRQVNRRTAGVQRLLRPRLRSARQVPQGKYNILLKPILLRCRVGRRVRRYIQPRRLRQDISDIIRVKTAGYFAATKIRAHDDVAAQRAINRSWNRSLRTVPTVVFCNRSVIGPWSTASTSSFPTRAMLTRTGHGVDPWPDARACR